MKIFQTVPVKKIIPLRHRVLRSGMPISSATFEGDDDPSTLHFAAIHPNMPKGNDKVLCCATFVLNKWKRRKAWQLRGMATDPAYQGKGLGKDLLAFAEHSIAEMSPIRRFWCNARLPAVSFYQKQGWRIASDVFDIPTAGPHQKMIKNLT